MSDASRVYALRQRLRGRTAQHRPDSVSDQFDLNTLGCVMQRLAVSAARAETGRRPKMARVTLATIAARTGLSKFAVSRSLSGKDGVSEETRRRVRGGRGRARLCAACADAEAPTLGVIFHDTDLINSELHLLIQSGFQAEAQRRGYQSACAGPTCLRRSKPSPAACSGHGDRRPAHTATLDAAHAPRHAGGAHGWLDAARSVRHRLGHRPRGRRGGGRVPARSRSPHHRLCARHARLSRPHRALLRRARGAGKARRRQFRR